MMYASVVAITHLPSYVTSIAVMGLPRPGMLVDALFRELALALPYRRTWPVPVPTATYPSPVASQHDVMMNQYRLFGKASQSQWIVGGNRSVEHVCQR